MFLFYALLGLGGCYAISGLIEGYLHSWFGVPRDVCQIVFNILMTVLPIIPTLAYVYLKNEVVTPDAKSEYSIDLCLALWIATSVLLWLS